VKAGSHACERARGVARCDISHLVVEVAALDAVACLVVADQSALRSGLAALQEIVEKIEYPTLRLDHLYI
jgi:hypothetical protein